MNRILRAARVITGSADLHDAWVAIEDGVITEIGEGAPPSGPVERVDGWLIPGFVDIHVHGGGGASFSAAEVTTATAFHQAHGTTTMLASLVSEPISTLIAQVEALLPYVHDGSIAGIHLEGPFIAAARRGAHDAKVLCDPDAQSLQKLLALAAREIRMVTLAPELQGSVEATRALADAGIIVALGHSDAGVATARTVVDAGARVVTHLFNGMRPLHHRDPGLADLGLLDDRVTCELILDTHHLSDEITRIALRLLADRWIAITDAVAAAGAPDGRFLLGGLDVEARDGIVRVVDTGSLAGSTLTMDVAFRNIVKRFQCTPLEAVQATATRPAALLRRDDIGVLAPGRRADLVHWQDLRVARVMKRGTWLP